MKANPRWRSVSAVADDCRILCAGVLVMCVYASNSLDFRSMPEQRKNIVLTISILIVVFALYFLNLPGIRGECDGGAHGEFTVGKGGAGGAHSVSPCRNDRGLGREGEYKQIEKPIPTPGKFDPLNLTFVHPSTNPSSPLPLPPHGRELGLKPVLEWG